MADTFEDIAKLKGENITFHVEDGKPVSGIVAEVDEDARTVTLQPGKRVVQFPAAEAKP